MRTLLAFVFLAALSAAGCQSRGAPPSTEGQPEEAPFSVALLETQACPLPPGVDPKQKRILGVKVRVEANHPGRVGANYFYASLLTKGGERYLAELGGCEPTLAHPPLAPGEGAEGFLNFPLPLDESPDRVVYSPNLDHTLGGDELSARDLSVELSVQ